MCLGLPAQIEENRMFAAGYQIPGFGEHANLQRAIFFG